MGVWDAYKTRLAVSGLTEREHAKAREKSYMERKFVNSLSYHNVLVNGNPQGVLILNQRKDINTKKICALPDQPLPHGGFVDFADSKWLITELDSNDEIYATAMMRRCNYLLKWINRKGKLIEKWCVVEDGTKYLIGEKEELAMSIGDARIAITLPRDEDTCDLSRGKRFLVDDPASKEVLAYQITKPNKLFNVYEGAGVFRFILNEVNVTDDDNVKLRIADYYNWTPYIPSGSDHVDYDIPLEDIVAKAIKEAEEKYGYVDDDPDDYPGYDSKKDDAGDDGDAGDTGDDGGESGEEDEGGWL